MFYLQYLGGQVFQTSGLQDGQMQEVASACVFCLQISSYKTHLLVLFLIIIYSIIINKILHIRQWFLTRGPLHFPRGPQDELKCFNLLAVIIWCSCSKMTGLLKIGVNL